MGNGIFLEREKINSLKINHANAGIEPESPALQADALPPGKPNKQLNNKQLILSYIR